MISASNLGTFVQAYFFCALWASTDTDENEETFSLDDRYDVTDIDADSYTAQLEECTSFCSSYYGMLSAAVRVPGYSWERAGHDFWLTRCGHGAGFWDRGLPGTLGDDLTQASKLFGNVDPYVGDDGLVHFS